MDYRPGVFQGDKQETKFSAYKPVFKGGLNRVNVLIVDTEQIDLETACKVCKECSERLGEEILAIPKGIDLIQDISIDWMIMIRDELDRRINEGYERRV